MLLNSLKREEALAIVSVKDTGWGIQPEIMPKVFSKFVTNSSRGTGLGLFICKSIIEAHGGEIWAENNEDGKGATFSFSLPATSNPNDSYGMAYNSYQTEDVLKWVSEDKSQQELGIWLKEWRISSILWQIFIKSSSGGGHGLMYQYPDNFSRVLLTFLET